MGRKKKEESNDSQQDSTKLMNLEDRLASQFGNGIMVSGAYIVERPRIIIPVSPRMDMMLNGGIPFGSFVIPTGPPKVGKTSLSIDLAATAVKMPTEFDVPRHIYYISVEGRIQPRDLSGIHHLDNINKDVTVIQSKIGKILVAEDFLDITEQLINEKPGSIFIMDSMSQLCSSSRREKDWHDGKAYRDDVPTMLSNFCKRISQVVPINQSLFIGITHRIANTGFGFSPWAEASGNKVQYQVDVKLQATHNRSWKEKQDDTSTLGIEVFWECAASPLQNGQSMEKTSSKFRFGWGVDKHAELLEIASDLGIIQHGGSWYTMQLDSGEQSKVQGSASARRVLIENPKTTVDIYNKFRDMMDLPAIPEDRIHLCL